MSEENAKQLVNHILSDNNDAAKNTFTSIMKHKLASALEAKKAAVATQIYSKKDT